jgi:hypothetical protein
VSRIVLDTDSEQALAEIEVTPKMIAAGVSVLWALEGEVSQETLAREFTWRWHLSRHPPFLQESR